MQPPWTATAYKQGLINAGICLAAFAGVFMLLLVLAKMIFGRIELPAFLAVCGCIWVLASFGFYGQWLYGKLNCGRLLLDLGGHPMWFVFLVNVFTLIPAIVFIATPKATDTMWVVIIRTFGCIFLAATTCGTFVLMATGRLQIREKGLWTYWGLVCWKDLANHEWKKNTLVFRSNAFGHWGMQAAIPIHPDKVAIVTHYLEKYAGRKPYLNSAREQEWSDDSIQPPGEVDTNIQKAEFRQPGE